MLDYDGTLAPLVAHPSLSQTDPESEAALHSLNKLPNVHVAVISGRAAEDAREKLQMDNITYAGNHGLEIIFHDKSRYDYEVSEQIKANFEKMVTELDSIVSNCIAFIAHHDVPYIKIVNCFSSNLVGRQWSVDRE